MDEEPKIVETTTFDDRRKILIHKSTEEKPNDLGNLKIVTTAEIHEKGIRVTLKDLEKKRKILKENIKIVSDNLGPAPKMNPELEKFKENLTKLQIIDRKKRGTKESIKKEETDLKNFQKDLKLVKKDLKLIKEAIGTRLKI